MNSQILNFEDFKLLLEGVTPTETLSGEVTFNFEFDPGYYKKEQIKTDVLARLMNDINQKMVPLLRKTNLLDRKITVELEASTSTVGITQALATELKTQPGTAGNVALCDARMKTLESIIVNALVKMMGIDEATLRTVVQFTKINKANSGTGATIDDQKKFQYIRAKVVQTGITVPGTRTITCDTGNMEFRGLQGKAETNYVGYGKTEDQRFIVQTSNGTDVDVTFNPVTIPDCFFVKYGPLEFLSPFLGSPTWTDGKGKVQNFVDQLAALPDLKEKINAELASIGATGTIETLRPDFFTPDGKVNVQPGPDQKGAPATTTFRFKKALFKEEIIIRVFSPLANTVFSIRPACRNLPASQSMTK